MKIIRTLLVVSVLGLLMAWGVSAINEHNREYKVRHDKEVQFNNLSKEILGNIEKFPGGVGLYIKDLQTNVELKYNVDKLFPSASIVKLPIMAAVFQAAYDGNIDLNKTIKLQRHHKSAGSGIIKRYRQGTIFTVDELVVLMIDESDNTATNMLVEELGLNYLNWLFVNRLKLKSTNMSRYIMDLKKRNYGIENYTTAEEIGYLLEQIYRGKLVDQYYSSKMLSILSRQRIKDRIPRFLPSNLTIAHKTGLMRDICHDAGIIFTSKGDFIICVLTSEVRNVRTAKKFIGNIAFKTYQSY